jgi:hypothetical protein
MRLSFDVQRLVRYPPANRRAGIVRCPFSYGWYSHKKRGMRAKVKGDEAQAPPGMEIPVPEPADDFRKQCRLLARGAGKPALGGAHFSSGPPAKGAGRLDFWMKRAKLAP